MFNSNLCFTFPSLFFLDHYRFSCILLSWLRACFLLFFLTVSFFLFFLSRKRVSFLFYFLVFFYKFPPQYKHCWSHRLECTYLKNTIFDEHFLFYHFISFFLGELVRHGKLANSRNIPCKTSLKGMSLVKLETLHGLFKTCLFRHEKSKVLSYQPLLLFKIEKISLQC